VSGFQSTLWTLIRGADRGDEAALRDFALKYRAPVVAYVAARGLAADAEDLAQEVFLRIFQDRVLSKADPARGRFRSLILSVTRHVIGHHVERQLARKRQAVQGPEPATGGDDEGFDREWVGHLIEVALARLAREHPPYHEALRLFLLEGRPVAEIARATGRAEQDVHNHLHRGRKKLADYLREQVRDYSSSREDFDEEIRSLSRFFPADGTP
jgi:RNA polymerase sigma-70 factor (ECF subfamily)